MSLVRELRNTRYIEKSKQVRTFFFCLIAFFFLLDEIASLVLVRCIVNYLPYKSLSISCAIFHVQNKVLVVIFFILISSIQNF